jgi:hypothetical protein
MAGNGKQDQFRLGFLTAIDVPERGFVGGLLVTNRQGRPLEFQCTTPVKANPTQQVLYGPTLTPFILGELIGGVLVEKACIKPHLILTDRKPILELRNHIATPVLWVALPESEPATDACIPFESIEIPLGKQVVRIDASHAEDRGLIEQEAGQLPKEADLCEPFRRVHEALLETVRGGASR